MTPLLFMLGFGLGIVLTFVRHPIYGLYTYMFAFYMAPSYTWWRNDVPDLRYLFIAAVVAVIASLRYPENTERAKWHATTPARLFMLFVLYNWLEIFWAIDPDLQREGAILYSKHLVSFYLMYRFANSLEHVNSIAFWHVVGCAWFGYQALDAGGGRLENIGGSVAGSNELGVHVSTGLLFGGILLLGLQGVRRLVLFGSLPLVVNCMVLTISRGAFLGLFSGGIAGYFSVPKALKRKYALCGILGLLLFGILAHEELIERFTETYIGLTSEQEQLDDSAAGRVDIAKAGLQMGLDYPFGAGHRATALLSPYYMDDELLSQEGLRSAHNTSAAVIAEHGFPGLALYYLTILWVLRTMIRTRRLAGSPELERVGRCVAFTASSLVAIYVSGNFSNNIDLETQYWCLGLLASLTEMYRTIGTRQEIPAPLEHTAARGRAPIPAGSGPIRTMAGKHISGDGGHA